MNLSDFYTGVHTWNDWREKNPKLSRLDLYKAPLQGANLQGANLRGAYLQGASLQQTKLQGANLYRAYLRGAHLQGANLTWADLSGAQFVRTKLCDAILTGSCVYGASVWDIKANERTKQQNLIITDHGEPDVTVDNIKVAQFIYLLLNNQEIRDVIDTIGQKGVLIF